LNLEDLGYSDYSKNIKFDKIEDGFEIGRVISEHKERYEVASIHGDFDAEITGNLRFSAEGREDFPAVGDWVKLMIYDNMALIHEVLPRFSILSRQAVGKNHEVQIIATNIDYAFLIQAIDRDFNINRIERYLAICYSANVKPIIVITKTDLIRKDEATEIIYNIKKRIIDVEILSISNETLVGIDLLKKSIEKGKTYCLLGSSGVGKSTLLNNLTGKSIMKTDEISKFSNRGRHITSHRELVLLENGGIMIDNPGMREIGMTDKTTGLDQTFDSIVDYAQHCKFNDCTHTNELGCAVLEALENGELDEKSYNNYIKMEKEKNHYESTLEERKRKDKSLGKIVKNYKKQNVKRKPL
jgi:ribosome biogenesis GTPase